MAIQPWDNPPSPPDYDEYVDASDSVSENGEYDDTTSVSERRARRDKVVNVLEQYVDTLFGLIMNKADTEEEVPEDYPERWLFKGDPIANGSHKDVANSLSTISIFFDKYTPVVYLLTFSQIIEELYTIDSSFLKYGHYKPAMRTKVEIDLDTEVEVYSAGFFNLVNKKTDERITISMDSEKLFVTGLKNLKEAENFQDAFAAALDKNDVFRNKTFTFTPQLHPKFITPSEVSRGDVILSEKIWKQIDINAINVFRRNADYKAKKIPTKRGIILEGPPGCQPANSKVLMGDGTWKNIQDIVIGDIVMSPQHDNSMVLSTVQETFKYKDKNTFKVSIKNGKYSYVCSDDHIIPMMAFLHNGYRNSSKYGLQEHTAGSFYKRGNCFKNRAKVFTSSAYDLPEKAYDIDPYVMGCMLGDGSVTGSSSTPNFTYSMKNSSAVYQDMILHGASFGTHSIKEEFGNVATVRSTKEFTTQIKASEIWGTNSHTKFVPEIYKLGSLQQRLELLAGLIDTDGTSKEFDSASVQLANDFKDLVFSVGGFALVKERLTSYSGKDGQQFVSYRVCYSIGEHVIPTRLEYKRNKPRNFDWKNHRNHKMTVQPNGIADVYGFRLDSASQWYITDNYLVTHNCGKSMVVKYLENELRGEVTYIYVTDGLVSGGGAISRIFDMAQHYSPCVLIFEDVDSIGASRDFGGPSITPELLSRLDGLEKLEDFVIVATTNYPEKIDEALRNRPNRFDRRIRVQRPESDSRLGLLKKFLAKKGYTSFTDEELGPIADALVNFSGAQINEVVVTAQMISLYAETPLTIEHLMESVEFMKENYYDDKNMGKDEGKKKVGFRAGSNR